MIDLCFQDFKEPSVRFGQSLVYFRRHKAPRKDPYYEATNNSEFNSGFLTKERLEKEAGKSHVNTHDISLSNIIMVGFTCPIA